MNNQTIKYALSGNEPLLVVGGEVPEGALEISTEEYLSRINTPSIEDTVAMFDSAMEEHLRSTRIARGYTVREPALYINSSNPRWRQDALDWVAFVDRVMEYGLEVQNQFQATGTPPNFEEFVANLPKISWTFSE